MAVPLAEVKGSVMRLRWLLAMTCAFAVAAAAWFGGPEGEERARARWTEIAPGILRSPGLPAGYALTDGDAALLIDAPLPPDGSKAAGIKKLDGILLTHHHRDMCAAVGKYLADKVSVRAPKVSAAWLTPESVRKYWKESLPLRNSNASYFVVPEGFDGIEYTLEDGQKIDWHGWSIQVVATPGHSRDHVAFVVRRQSRERERPEVFAFVGDALAAPGKLWAPYTTDWDHWTDAGLTPAAKSLRKLAALKPGVLLPAHGPVIKENATAALTKTAEPVEEVAFLKSFERFTKKRLGNAPEYRFLAKDQAESNGSKAWSRISEHLWITGNTYVLNSKDNAYLVVDPWDKRSADQVVKLQKEQRLGKLDVVMFSHAHFDHYDGVYYLPDRDKWQVWTLDKVAPPIADPNLFRAPFLDVRPVKFDRTPKDGDTLTWREYTFRFHHFPGQTEFTMGVETVIDGKKCFFTADNFFHQDMFSGSGGWMGLNRSYPLPYSASAKMVLDAAPDWVLAEHGGPFEFVTEDWRRRVQWGEACAKAADALCLSGNHHKDWNPHRIHVEPVVQKARPGATLHWTLVTENPLPAQETLAITLEGRGIIADQTWQLDVPGGKSVRREFSARVPEKIGAGRHVLVVRGKVDGHPDESDSFIVVDVD
jgi:glyoxylase-like metal-dependent hydrolase (beta-lactamase superfamily II)